MNVGIMSNKSIEVIAERLKNLDDNVKEGFNGVHARQDKTNGRIERVENRTVNLETFQTQVSTSLSIFKWLFGFLGVGNLIMFLNTLIEII